MLHSFFGGSVCFVLCSVFDNSVCFVLRPVFADAAAILSVHATSRVDKDGAIPCLAIPIPSTIG
jgi:hypothetical protein